MKIVLLSGTFLFNSCQRDDDDASLNDNSLEISMQNLINTAKETSFSINQLFIKKNLKDEKSLAYYRNEVPNIKNVEALTEIDAQVALSPFIDETKTILSSVGVTDLDLELEFGSADDPRIALVGAILVAMEDEENVAYNIDFTEIFGQKIYAQSGIGNCVLEAMGINALKDLARGGIKSLGKKGVMKIIGKVASKYLGWVGAAIAVADFADCMGWLGLEENNTSSEIIRCNNNTLLKVKLNFSNSYVLISKESIQYISKFKYTLPYTHSIPTYYIEAGYEGVDDGCFVKKKVGKDVFGEDLDMSTVEEYNFSDNYSPINDMELEENP